jgi:hypothetical protein
MFRALAASTAAVLLLSACATTPRTDVDPAPQPQAQPAGMTPPAAATAPASGAFDPVGTYDFSVDIQGQRIGGTMAITKAQDGTLGGEMYSDQGALTFNSVTVEGRTMTASGALPNGGPSVVFVMEFAGDDFAGTFSVEGASGTIAGKRRKA